MSSRNMGQLLLFAGRSKCFVQLASAEDWGGSVTVFMSSSLGRKVRILYQLLKMVPHPLPLIMEDNCINSCMLLVVDKYYALCSVPFHSRLQQITSNSSSS